MSPTRFIIAFFIPILLASPLAGANYLFLRNAGELDSIEQVAAMQQKSSALYGTALHPNVYPYKIELLRASNPKVVVIGSSRVLQIRGSHFLTPFVNLGRTVNYPAEAEKLVEDMLAVSKPELVLFGVDFWWFNPHSIFAFTFASHEFRGGELSVDALIAPVKWLWQGKVSPSLFFNIIRSGHPFRVNRVPMFGVQAIVLGNGFSSDGSNYYLGTVYGRGSAEDPKFSDTLSRIARKIGQFRQAREIDESRFEVLRRTIERLEAEGIRVITFLPPLAPTVLAAMKQDAQSYQYIDEVRARMPEISAHHFDFHDGRVLGTSDCEFVDGFHGGDVTFGRLLDAIATDPSSGLSRYFAAERVRAVIKMFAGNALSDHRYRLDGENELDFLEIGCAKT